MNIPRPNSHLQARIGSIRQGSAASVDTDRDTANQIAHPHSQPAPKQGESGVKVGSRVQVLRRDGQELRGEYNGDDDAVDCDDLAKDDGDEVFGADSRGLYTAADDRYTRQEDAPGEIGCGYELEYNPAERDRCHSTPSLPLRAASEYGFNSPCCPNR